MRRRTQARVVLVLGLIAGAVVWSMRQRQHRIDVVDTTAPDAFGSAVVREEAGAAGMG